MYVPMFSIYSQNTSITIPTKGAKLVGHFLRILVQYIVTV